MNRAIKTIEPDRDQRWNRLVSNHPFGSIYHLTQWAEVISTTYNYAPKYIGVEDPDTGELAEGMSFFFIHSRLTGKRLVSLPFSAYCDPLIEGDVGPFLDFILDRYAGVKYIELKYFRSAGAHSDGRLKADNRYVTHILDLNRTLDQLFASFQNTSVRQRIKRAERNNLLYKIAEDENGIKKFYDLEISVRKKHGLPPQPLDFFMNIWRYMGPHKQVFVPLVEHEGKTIAAAVVLRFKDTYYLEYSASDQDALNLCPNQKLIWETIQFAHKNEAKFFDFGRSSVLNAPLIEFKERWNADRRSLTYYYYPEPKKVKTESGFVHRILNFTNRFLPPSMLNLEGKLIYRHFG